MQHFRTTCIATQITNIAIHQQKKAYFDNLTEWRFLMLDSSELLESQISSCQKTKKANYMCLKNGKQLHINKCLSLQTNKK